MVVNLSIQKKRKILTENVKKQIIITFYISKFQSNYFIPNKFLQMEVETERKRNTLKKIKYRITFHFVF